MTLLDIVKNHVPLHKSGSRYAGPCPKCGGDNGSDRFSVNLAKDYCHCFACAFNADAVKFLREIEGLKCPDAHEQAGIPCANPDCPAADKCRLGHGKKVVAARPLTVPRAAPATTWHPAAATSPKDHWQQHAQKLVDWAHQQLLANPEQLQWLAARGLDLDAVNKYRLGWVPQDMWRERAAWGLPAEHKDDGKLKKLWIPAGLTIPSHINGQIHRVRIRRPQGDLRYYAIPGSGDDITILGNPDARAVVVVESDLDALLIDHAAGDIVRALPLTTCSSKPRESAAPILAASLRILVALDFDPAGANSWPWWQRTWPQSRRWPVPQGKDPGEAYKAGVDIRAWIIAGLPPALTLPAPAIQEPAPHDDHPHPVEYLAGVEGGAQEPPKATVRAFALYHETVGETRRRICEPVPMDQAADIEREGRRVFYLTDDPSEYRRLQAEQIPTGRAVFSVKEAQLVRDAERNGAAMEIYFDIKEIFGGSVLETRPHTVQEQRR